ncbi:MAG: helix-turn-helix domain-containing protein [Leptospirillum sp.]
MTSLELSRLARILVDLSDRPVLYWASVCGFHPSNVSNWLRGRETLSEENIARLLSVLSLDPDTLKLVPSRVHVWIVALHEPEPLIEASKNFLESPIEMALVSPDPDGPASLSQAPQVALLRSGNLRIVLLRKLFPAKMSESPLSQKAGTPWIRPSLIPGARWKSLDISPDEDAPPLSVPGPFLFNLVLGNVSLEQFDALMDKSAPWNWKDVEALAKKSGMTAREVAEMIRAGVPVRV